MYYSIKSILLICLMTLEVGSLCSKTTTCEVVFKDTFNDITVNDSSLLGEILADSNENMDTKPVLDMITQDGSTPVNVMCPDDIIAYTEEFDSQCESFVINSIGVLPPEIVTVVNDYTGTSDATALYPVGSFVVVWTLTDSTQNITQCAQLVTVIDEIPPTVNCPSSIFIDADSMQCIATSPDIGNAFVSDNCSLNSLENNAPDTFELGTTVVIWTAMDNSGNTNSCASEITLDDNQNPEIECADDISILIEECSEFTTVEVDLPIASDNCGIVSLTNNITNTIDTTLPIPYGTTNVIWTVLDYSGYTAQCTQSVMVQFDNPLPDLDDDGIIDECDSDIDGDGYLNELDCAPLDLAIYPGADCDDGDPNSFGDSIQEDCSCSGVVGLQEDNSIFNGLQIYPNPADGILFISLSNNSIKNIDYTLSDIYGKSVYSGKSNNTKGTLNTGINITAFSPGIYFLKVKVNDQQLTKRIAISR